MDVRNRSARRQNKKVIFLSADKLTCLQFYRKIESEYLEKILSVTEAFTSKRDKQCIIVGKVVKLESKIPNDIRKDIKEKSHPATFIIMREVVASNETFTYGRFYKVKFSGAIAKEFIESNIKVGDRIALKNLAAIEENTEYSPCARYSTLTPIALDGSETTVIIGKKVVEERRCNTPDSEDQNFSSLQRNDRTEVEELDSPAPKSSGLCSGNKRRFNNDSAVSSSLASPAKSHNKTPNKSKKIRVNSPPKTPLHIALEENEEQSNTGNDACSSLAKISQQVKYINLKDINESLVNSKVDIFGIVIDVLQSQGNGKKKKMLRLRIIDSTIPLHKAFEILVFYNDRKPKICKRWIARLKNVKIEAIRGEVNGRIFSSSCLICFPTEKGMPKFVTTRKKPYEFPDEDKQVLKSLKAFLANQRSWNILTLPNSYYADEQNRSVPPLKLENITENTSFFSLKCKIVSLRIFLEVKMAFLTVEDSTVCHPRTYQFPKTAKSWSAVVQNKEVYCGDSSTIDILLKNLGHSCDSEAVNLLMQTGIFVDITEIQTRKTVSENNHGLLFIADMEKTKITRVNRAPSPPPPRVEPPPTPEGESEESSRDESGVKISEYNELLAECRDESMSPTTARLLAPVPEKKREPKKRRKLVPTDSGANILTHDFPQNSTDDVNVPVDENEQVVRSIDNRNSALEGTELSKSSDPSRPSQPTQKVSLNKPSSSEKTKINPVGSEKLPVLVVHMLTDDEIIELSRNASVSSEIKKKGDRQSPDHQRISSPVGKEKSIGPKSTNSETSCPTSKPGTSSNVALKSGIVVIVDDASPTTSKQKEVCFGEGSVQLPLSNETIDARSPHIESSAGVEDLDHTVYKNVPLDECSLIESCEVSDNVPNSSKSLSPKKDKTKFSSDKDTAKGSPNQTKPLTRNSARNLFPLESPSVMSSSSREIDTGRNRTTNKDRTQPSPFSNSSPPKNKKLPDRNPQNFNKKKTSQCDKVSTTRSPSLFDTQKTLLNHSRGDSVDAVLDMDKSILENDGTDEDMFNPGKTSTSVKNVCSVRTENSPVPTTRLRSGNEESQVYEKSTGSSSQTQFSSAVTSNLRKASIDVHNVVAPTNRLSPTPSIMTEKYYPTRERLKCTRKRVPHKSRSTERPPSCPSSPQSIATEQLYIPGEQEICTRKRISQKRKFVELALSPPVFTSPESIVTENYKRIPHKTDSLQQKIEAGNTSFCLEKWLKQVDSEIVIGEHVEPVAEPMIDESQNLENIEESQNLAEYMTTREDFDNNPSHEIIISDNAVIINSEPSILDKPLDIVSGYCKEPCDAFFRYSILEFNSDSKPICPKCNIEGKSIEVDLDFLFKLNLILHKSRNVRYAALVHSNQASQFLRCTVEEYISDEGLRSRIVNNLSEHFLLKGKTSSAVYSPSLPVNLRVINDDESESRTFNLVDTILPEPDASSPPIESFFSNYSNL